MPSIPQILLRGLQLLCVIILTGLVAGAIDVQHFFNDSVNYAMFTTVFSWIVVIYGLSAAFVESLAHPIILLVLDGFAIGFNFIAGVTLAARLGAHSCSNSNYINHNDLAQGITKRCRELQAATALCQQRFQHGHASWWRCSQGCPKHVPSLSKKKINQQGRSLQQRKNISVKWRWSSTIRG
ncbi:hypothetical protein EYC84_010916 [Monilinia fructicola]|uniref:MARVEL domain-containing protein n=1 Tax=Monilinia fructicola TaxID=38448 RepID=A0A5M9J8Q1_MONFR|nr:hypothetical protein EYC84_010916 [Monilinia fructicola]